jgi:hypothetical protein
MFDADLMEKICLRIAAERAARPLPHPCADLAATPLCRLWIHGAARDRCLPERATSWPQAAHKVQVNRGPEGRVVGGEATIVHGPLHGPQRPRPSD